MQENVYFLKKFRCLTASTNSKYSKLSSVLLRTSYSSTDSYSNTVSFMLYFCWFWYEVIQRAFYIIRSRKAETERAWHLLDDIENEFKGQFNPATKKKIAVSYGIYNPMICDTFTGLHNRSTNNKEKNRFIHYFICSSLFDDFTDHELITEDQLQKISFQQEKYEVNSFDEKVFLYAHQMLLNFIKEKQDYDLISQILFDAQMQSKKQYQSNLSDDAVRDITFSKGGNSVLLCSYYLDTPPDNITYQCWYKIGTLIQLTNDLYDIYKDLQDNISTLPNRMKSAFSFEHFFIEQIQEMKALIAQLPYPQKQKKEFSLSMAGIYAFGLIAIAQLKRIQGKANYLPDLKTLSRKNLIVDMERPSNLSMWFKFVYRYARI